MNAQRAQRNGLILAAVILVLIAAVGATFSMTRNTQAKIDKGQAQIAALSKKKAVSTKAPAALIKTMPSIYKQLQATGKKVAAAEQVMIEQNNAAGGLDTKNADYLNAYGLMKQYVSNADSDWQPVSTSWAPLSTWTVEVLPGGISASGAYNVAFVYKDDAGDMMALVTGTYIKASNQFTGLKKFITAKGSAAQLKWQDANTKEESVLPMDEYSKKIAAEVAAKRAKEKAAEEKASASSSSSAASASTSSK